MMLLLKIVFFIALLNVSVQVDLPASTEKPAHPYSNPGSSKNDSLSATGLPNKHQNQSGRRSNLSILIKSPLISEIGSVLASSAAHASSMGHSSQTVSHTAHTNTQLTQTQSGLHSSGNQQSYSVNGNSILSQSPVVANVVAGGITSAGQHSAQFAGGMSSNQQILAVQPHILDNVNHQAIINQGQSALGSFASSNAQVSQGIAAGSINQQTLLAHGQGWTSGQGGSNVILQPLVSGSSGASIVHGVVQGHLDNFQIAQNTPTAILQPDYVQFGSDQGYNGQSVIGHQTSSSSFTHTNTGGSVFGAKNTQTQQSGLTGDGSLIVSVSISNDGLYANEFSGQQTLLPAQEPNSQIIAAMPVLQPEHGQGIIGYRPNILYYLRQIRSSDIWKNILNVQQAPSFISTLQPGQMDFMLSRAQLELYKAYLIRTGLIRLKPFRLIFNNRYRYQLPSIHWMVVNLGSDLQSCYKPCNDLFQRDTFLTSWVQKKVPVRLLVPILKIRSGWKKTISGTSTMLGGMGDISSGFYRMATGGLKASKDTKPVKVDSNLNKTAVIEKSNKGDEKQ